MNERKNMSGISQKIETVKKKSIVLKHADLMTLAGCVLFKAITADDISSLLSCLQATTKNYTKGEFIQSAGEPINKIGVVIKGNAEIIQEDLFGRKTILTSVGRSGIFGEAIVTAQLAKSPVSVVASNDTTICFLDYHSIVRTCGTNCQFHTALIENMLEIMAKKTLLLSKKLNYALMKSIRDKITSYLLDEFSKKQRNSKTFTIQYNREELADYLSVDRSALSRELSRMKEEGLIDYRKNEFTLLFID